MGGKESGKERDQRGENVLTPGTVELGSPLFLGSTPACPWRPGGCEGHRLIGSADEARRSE